MRTVKFGQTIDGGIVITLGFMDCVHIGHRELIGAAQRAADGFNKSCGGAAVKTAAFTFCDNPFMVLKKDILPVYDFETRVGLLETDYVVYAEFDAAFAAMSGEAFLDKLFLSADIKAVVVGSDYRFSANAACGIAELKEYLSKRGASLIVADTVTSGGVKAASSDIRRYLADGDVRSANTLLGSHYRASGTVVKGTHTGTALGFPTANVLHKTGLVRLKPGVYLTRTTVDGQDFGSVTNAGSRPTFDTASPYIYETYIDGFCGDLYGKYIEIQFIGRIRDIEKFENKDALIKRLEEDKQFIKK
ncbi:MAG: hypothetical protein LBT30_04010 [Clostridiales bacterium]|jgi:riboflavin kinase/FMN adenylyltransferase|nr:hypothetical protein [Clostridiales bacterium]